MLRNALLLPAVALGFCAGVMAFHPNPRRLLGVSDQAQGHLVLGQLELRRDSGPALERALDHFREAASAGAEGPARGGAAEVELAQAEALAASATWSGSAEAGWAMSRDADELAARGFAHARAALLLDPGDVAGNRALADYFRLKGDAQRMREHLQVARRRAPADPAVGFIECAGLSNDGSRRRDTIACLEALLARAPEQQRARLWLATLWAAEGDPQKARAIAGRLLQEVSAHEAALRLAEALDRGRPGGGVATAPAPPPPPPPGAEPSGAAEPAIAETPEAPADFEALLERAGKLRRGGRSPEALALYEKALTQRPDGPNALAGKGWCLYDLGRYDEAATAFRAVLAQKPRAPGAHLGMADVARAQGQREAATHYYERYLQILPDGPESDRAKRAIREMEP